MPSSLGSYWAAVADVLLMLLLRSGRIAHGFGFARVAALALLGGFLNPHCDDKLEIVAAGTNPGNSAKQPVSKISCTSENGWSASKYDAPVFAGDGIYRAL